MKTNQWITDRLPMEADLNEFGHIVKPDNTVAKGWRVDNTQRIKLGDPWFPVQTMPTFISSDDVFWDKPSDFPPFCWVMAKEDKGCYLVTNPSVFIKFRPMSAYRWAPQPFNTFAEGSLCTK